MDKQTLTIAGIEEIKRGFKKTGEPYIMLRVKDTNGKKHTTFLEGLQIGETYNFLTIKEPFKGKDGNMHEGSKITGFDNVAYENKQERPATQSTPSRPAQVNLGGLTGFTENDRRTLEAILAGIDTLVKYTTGQPD